MATATNTLAASGRADRVLNYRDSLLRRVFMVNEIATAIFALLLIALSAPLSEAIGLAQPSWMVIIGVVLVGFCAFVWDTARRDTLESWRAWAIIVLDFGWVIASIALLLTNALNLTTGGNWAVLIIADLVLMIGIAEVVTYRRYTQGTKV